MQVLGSFQKQRRTSLLVGELKEGGKTRTHLEGGAASSNTGYLKQNDSLFS